MALDFLFDDFRVFAGTGKRTWSADQSTLVFIHGAGMDHSVWLMYERYFANHGFNVLSLDLPGHGRSAGAPLPTIEAMADWVDGVMRNLDVSTATLVGHSMGALVAYDCAARHADRVVKAILLGFALPMAVGPALLEAARTNDPAAIDMMVIFGHDFRSQLGGNRSAGVHVVNSNKRLLERNKPGVLHNDLNACNEYKGPQTAESIRCPVIFASGDRDKMTAPRSASAMAQQLINGSAVQIEHSGHGVMAEQPELTHRFLVAALGTSSR
jgi:pimeloyl-ACP methyl ester carboxylesterase